MIDNTNVTEWIPVSWENNQNSTGCLIAKQGYFYTSPDIYIHGHYIFIVWCCFHMLTTASIWGQNYIWLGVKWKQHTWNICGGLQICINNYLKTNNLTTCKFDWVHFNLSCYLEYPNWQNQGFSNEWFIYYYLPNQFVLNINPSWVLSHINRVESTWHCIKS